MVIVCALRGDADRVLLVGLDLVRREHLRLVLIGSQNVRTASVLGLIAVQLVAVTPLPGQDGLVEAGAILAMLLKRGRRQLGMALLHALADGHALQKKLVTHLRMIGVLALFQLVDDVDAVQRAILKSSPLPRPERPEMVVRLEQRFTHYSRRSLVKPGLTGWAKVRCGYAGTESAKAWELCHDLYYLKHRSLFTDLLILVQTGVEVTRDAHRALRAPRRRFTVGERVGEQHGS
jgi:hypothetical protein